MKWKKLGQIFDFNKSSFKDKFISHSQSPQALVFKNFVRIYFSTRKKSENRKFLSYIQYVDFDKSFSKIINQSNHEVLALGNLGSFDEHGIFPMNPIKVKNKIYAYTSGWTRRVSVDVDSGIGLVVSKNGGETFRRIGAGPVLTSSLYEPFLVIDGFVKRFDDIFHMWYIYGTDWKIYHENKNPERTYVIGHAISHNGIDWKKENRQIIESKYKGECQALPTVIKKEDRYHMYFCHRNSYDFRNNPKKSYKLGYAYSDDLLNWIRDDSLSGIDVSENSWDSDMMCYPNLFVCFNEFYLLYNGNDFGKNGFGLAKLIED